MYIKFDDFLLNVKLIPYFYKGIRINGEKKYFMIMSEIMGKSISEEYQSSQERDDRFFELESMLSRQRCPESV